MQRKLSLSNSKDGISPIIGTILILAIMVSITGTMLAWGIPQIQQSEAYAIYTSAQNNFLNFDADLDQVLIQGEGSSRSSTVSFSAGTFVHRENLDEIRYYYETTTWSSFEIIGVKNEATSFAIIDNKKVIENFDLTISYPNGTVWEGESSAHIVSGFPSLVYGTSATYTSTVNSTVVGGFFVYGVDSLSYKYSSVSGVYKMRLFNGGIVTKEPGGIFYVSSKPIIRSIATDDAYESLVLYQTDYNMTTGAKSLTGGNYNFEARNQGGKDSSFEVYNVRMGFSGDSSTALKNYYSTYWGFGSETYTISSTQSTAAANMGFEEDIFYSQGTAFDFRILERTIHVTFNLR
ncbi:MAG: hypothetical protein BEU00_00845 [Marine Group III euryarchaeote CG-Epi3]|uniref:Uncharacterized protein n=1 Tax=Marine Group III euryarchaeote CG-Epi3 TaxID=1888997 RepID=A0A1J5TSQ2_9ARCH|nr:MAG: hypothetical protein BEU00_00845 [Marine Group III euryarchaeote CG-Epi3]